MDEFCAGVIVANGRREFLLVQSSKSRTWLPPKGHMEKGETAMEAALRELEEETGIRAEDISIGNDVSFAVTYTVKRGTRNKQVTFFLAVSKDSDGPAVRLSSEHGDYRWAGLEDAVDLVLYGNNKNQGRNQRSVKMRDMESIFRRCHSILSSSAET